MTNRRKYMKGVSKGNVRRAAARKGWFVGHFMTHDPDRQTGHVEAKWGVHRISARKKPFEGSYRSKSMSILINGRFRFEFRQGEHIERVVLKQIGDYVVWFPKVDHRGFAEVDKTVMLTIRWPSLSHNRYECPEE